MGSVTGFPLIEQISTFRFDVFRDILTLQHIFDRLLQAGSLQYLGIKKLNRLLDVVQQFIGYPSLLHVKFTTLAKLLELLTDLPCAFFEIWSVELGFRLVIFCRRGRETGCTLCTGIGGLSTSFWLCRASLRE